MYVCMYVPSTFYYMIDLSTRLTTHERRENERDFFIFGHTEKGFVQYYFQYISDVYRYNKLNNGLGMFRHYFFFQNFKLWSHKTGPSTIVEQTIKTTCK